METDHYKIEVHLGGLDDEKVATEIGALLEAGWLGFADFMRKKPKKRARKLEIALFPDEAAWRKSYELLGLVPPPGEKQSWYVAKRGQYKLYGSVEDSFTRLLLLSGAFREFHYSLKSKHKDMVDTWFVRGLSEHFGTHFWDGETLQLGVREKLTGAASGYGWVEKAIELLEPTAVGDNAFTVERIEVPEVRWALIRFLLLSGNEEYEKSFRKLALGARGSKLTAHGFARSLGEPAQLARDLYDWLLNERNTLYPRYSGWSENLDGVRGQSSSRSGWTAAITKEKCARLAVTLDAEALSAARGGAGILLDAEKTEVHHCMRFSNGLLLLEKREEDRWETISELVPPAAPSNLWRLEAEFKDGLVLCFVNGQKAFEIDPVGDHMGLESHGGFEALFTEVEWN